MTDRTLFWLGENSMAILRVLGALVIAGGLWSAWSLWRERKS